MNPSKGAKNAKNQLKRAATERAAPRFSSTGVMEMSVAWRMLLIRRAGTAFNV
jgi:hypothetical protein